jgi:anti-anti-sigma factor
MEVVEVTHASFAVEVIGGMPVVTAPCEVDVANAEELRQALRNASAQGHGPVVVDMTHTWFCDSAALHVMVDARKRGDDLLLVVTSSNVLRVLAITGIDTVIPNFSTLDEALARMPGP